MPDKHGHFGRYGGMFVPETLMSALNELSEEYERAKADPLFQTELNRLLHEYVGRPTPLYFAERWTEKLGGARIYLKREDLLHTGAHKINNALGQALLALRLGKQRIIAETGAGQHGVATATVCARGQGRKPENKTATGGVRRGRKELWTSKPSAGALREGTMNPTGSGEDNE